MELLIAMAWMIGIAFGALIVVTFILGVVKGVRRSMGSRHQLVRR